ncbi:SURF1 family protein [Xylophilus sp.]|uniref:SURF1 family protein n=1 Tax=Xylophilus sp. TaxID=2653893 RepID=UPI0013B6A338|nr:SURF1 family protein [Xylophilus sp.]KAF1047808.1 MAG: putative SURF1-like protein [Xylophilus sp.]
MTAGPVPLPPRQGGGRARRLLIGGTALLLVVVFVALGSWQLQRRSWKLELIARVTERVTAPPADIPPPSQWKDVNAGRDEYRRVRIIGRFLNDRETFVQATTELGAGFWVLTPMVRADGTTVLVNRGFVPPERRAQDNREAAPPQGETTVTGLLRLSEPHGGFLRKNSPEENRWHSRDVPAIAAARGLRNVAPFFIDAQWPDGQPRTAQWPVPGLTVLSFYNNHLAYAATWFGLALMTALAGWWLLRQERMPVQG